MAVMIVAEELEKELQSQAYFKLLDEYKMLLCLERNNNTTWLSEEDREWAVRVAVRIHKLGKRLGIYEVNQAHERIRDNRIRN